MSRGFRALVVDDEEPARQRLLDLLSDASGWHSVAVAADGRAAVEAIRDHRPDLVFLDVQMPEMTGLDVVREVGAENLSAVVFVTAYDEYAVQAFEAFALDYLLKPYSDARFRQALDRCEQVLRLSRHGDLHARIARLLDRLGDDDRPGTLTPAPPASARIPVQGRDRTLLLPIPEIDYVSADGPYMRLVAGTREFLIRERIKNLEQRFAAHRFQRIHRSTLVNLDRVVAVEPYFRGEAFVVLQDGVKLKVSRSRREALLRAVGVADAPAN